MKFKKYLLLLLFISLSIVLFGCSKDNNEVEDKKIEEQTNQEEQKNQEEEKKEHVHEFNVKSLKEEYLISNATCTTGSIYYYSCECGECGTKTFMANDAKGHTYTKGTSFYTNLEDKESSQPEEGMVRVFFKCSECDEDVYIDYAINDHEHICHEGSVKTSCTHEATCAICNQKYEDSCMYNDLNECIFCDNEKECEYGDNLWKLSYDNVEVVTQNDVKAYFFGKGEETYDDITVTKRTVNYVKSSGCVYNKEIKKFQYILSKETYQLEDETDISSYGWFMVSFKISKCVDAVGITTYYKFSNGNIGIYFDCNGECSTSTYHEYNEKGQLLIYKTIVETDENTKELVVYTYSYGKEW